MVLYVYAALVCASVRLVQFSSVHYIFYRALFRRHEEGLREHCSDNVAVCLSVRVWVCVCKATAAKDADEDGRETELLFNENEMSS
jgi:hypothetical protein